MALCIKLQSGCRPKSRTYMVPGEVVRVRRCLRLGKNRCDLGLGSSLTRTNHDLFEMDEKEYEPSDPRGEYLETTNEAEIVKLIMWQERTHGLS